MFSAEEEVRRIHILGVARSRNALEKLVGECKFNRNSRYVLLELDAQGENLQEVLAGLGIRGTMTGAQYLHDAVMIAMEDQESVKHITKLMYPQLARLHGVTAGRIERAIRVAIERSWKSGDSGYKRKVFRELAAPGQPRPTNATYIAAVADYFKRTAGSDYTI